MVLYEFAGTCANFILTVVNTLFCLYLAYPLPVFWFYAQQNIPFSPLHIALDQPHFPDSTTACRGQLSNGNHIISMLHHGSNCDVFVPMAIYIMAGYMDNFWFYNH